jgi:hypothetical protein
MDQSSPIEYTRTAVNRPASQRQQASAPGNAPGDNRKKDRPMQPQLFTSATEDHYTPAAIAERCRFVFGGAIDLDPASSAKANATIKARRYYADPHTQDAATLNDRHFDPVDRDVSGKAIGVTHIDQLTSAGRVAFDGLRQSWRASTLFLNPPFSVPARDANGAIVLNAQGKPKRERVIDRWVARWVAATTPRSTPGGKIDAAGMLPLTVEADQAILLVPARTDTQWFAPLFNQRYALAFISGRLHFNEADNGATFPSVLVYAGANVDRFYLIFEDIATCGKLVR